MSKIISLERERAVRELRAAVGPEEAERILCEVAPVMERVEADQKLLTQMLRWMNETTG